MPGPEESRDLSATHAVDGAALRRFQLKLGWSNDLLSSKSNVHVKTIMRARKSQRIQLDAIKRLGKALGIEFERLFLSEQPVTVYGMPTGEDINVTISEDKRFEVTITIGIPYEEFKKPEVKHAFIALLGRVIRGSEKININSIKEGSTLATLEMSTQDILRLLAEMMDGTLKNMNVIKISLEDDSWVKRMLVCLRELGTPIEPDAEAWSEMLNSRMVEVVS